MNPRILFPCAALAAGIAFSCSDPSLCVGDQCSGVDASLGDGGPTGDATLPADGASSDAAMQADAVAPNNCNTMMDISTQPGCVVDGYGLFVDSNASPTGANGTRANPYPTIMAAVDAASTDAQHARIFACAGTYAEHVVISANVSLYGGFECSGWTHPTPAAVTTLVKPKDAGPALVLSNVAGSIIEDLEFDAQDGESEGETSVAVVLSAVNQVTFRNSTIMAGAAGPAPSAAGTTANHPDGGAAMGLTPVGTTDPSKGVGPQMCTACLDNSASIGGASGGGGPSGGSQGGTGGPLADGGGGDGLGGMYTAHCNIGDDGANSVAAQGGSGAASAGSLGDGGSWTATSGKAGSTAAVAQGGGGGSGGDYGSNTSIGAGGGGGCGGCGGGGGMGGAAGGSSFGVLAFNSVVTFDTCTITAGVPSNGGKGGDGQAGQAGGFGGTQSAPGCPGGGGGTGGNGGGGGGGAAGISVGVAWAGASGSKAPTLTSTTPTFSSTTALGGQPGAYGGATAGQDGANAAMVPLPMH